MAHQKPVKPNKLIGDHS